MPPLSAFPPAFSIRKRSSSATKAIHALLDHAAKQDQQLQEVMQQLAKLGVDVATDAEVGKAFDVNYLNKIVD